MSKKALPATPPQYFVNRYADIFFAGGASLLTFAILRIFHSGERSPWVYMSAAWLSWVCNWPHFSATNYRLYRFKENRAQYPMTAFIVPIFVLAGVLGSFFSSHGFAPYFVKLFTIWSPYHFSGQTLGITLIYARRSGIWVQYWERKILSLFIYSTFFAQSLWADVGLRNLDYYGIKYPSLGAPMWMGHLSDYVMYAATAGYVALMIYWSVKRKKAVPLILLIPGVSQFVWFIVGSRWDSFQEFVPFFHSLQYLLIAWSIQLQDTAMRGNLVRSAKGVWKASLNWGFINFVGGAALFYYIPILASHLGAGSVEFATGVFIAGVQIHHFFVDGVIWKLKSSSVASPLLGNFYQLLAAPQKKKQMAESMA